MKEINPLTGETLSDLLCIPTSEIEIDISELSSATIHVVKSHIKQVVKIKLIK